MRWTWTWSIVWPAAAPTFTPMLWPSGVNLSSIWLRASARTLKMSETARSAGVDGQTAFYISTVRGEEEFLAELRADLKARSSGLCLCGSA